jgi:hypothetical protein
MADSAATSNSPRKLEKPLRVGLVLFNLVPAEVTVVK